MYLVQELPTADNLHARTRHFALKKARLSFFHCAALPAAFSRTVAELMAIPEPIAKKTSRWVVFVAGYSGDL